jgi:putative PIN family toxin of toxin-antitoxin system
VKIVLDTNVFVSGIFFGGPPGTVLEAWQDGRVQLVVSLEVLTEYNRVCDELALQFANVDPSSFLALAALQAEVCEPAPLPEQVCVDPDDDKFISLAASAGASCVVTGDKLLLAASGYEGIEVIRPREFIDRYLTGS